MSIGQDISKEINFARKKFPGRKYMLAALVEEVGELHQAMIDHSRGKQTSSDVYAEAIQVAAMAIRIAQEGDAEFPYQFSEQCSIDFNNSKKFK